MSLRDLLVTIVDKAHISIALVAASYALLIHDYLLSFSEEVALIWQGKWSLPFILFLCTRYIAFVDVTIFLLLVSQVGILWLGWTPSGFQAFSNYIGWSWCIGVFVAQNILILRTYALCNRNKRLISCLILVHFGCTAGLWVVNFQLLRSVIFVGVPPNNPIATAFRIVPLIVGPVNHLWRAYLILFLDETVIVGITILYIFRAGGYHYTTLIWTIWRDGIGFYLWLQAFSLFNLFFIRFGSSYFYFLTAASFHRVLHSILTARMLLNLRRAALPEQGREGLSFTFGEPSVEFWEPDLPSSLDFSESMVQTSLAED